MLAMGGIAVVAALPAVVAWPGLARVELLYGLGARLPTAAITVAAVFAGWGTHYEKFGPHDFAGMGSGEAAMWLAFTQVVFWIPFTIIAGGLFGSLAAAFVPGRERG
jgi:hypothetical protein